MTPAVRTAGGIRANGTGDTGPGQEMRKRRRSIARGTDLPPRSEHDGIDEIFNL